MRFNYFQPSGILRDFVEYYFVIEKSAIDIALPMITFPNINQEMVFTYGSPECSLIQRGDRPLTKVPDFSVDGFSTNMNTYSNDNELGVIMVGFRPAGLRQFIPFCMNEFMDRNLNLKEIWPDEIRQLEDVLHTKNTDTERIASVEQFLCRKLKTERRDFSIEHSITQVISTKGNITVNDLASAHYLSTKQFTRRFIQTVGTTPKLFSRIVRFQHIISLMKREEMLLTDMALEAGYYDQAHFIKEFRQFTNESPSSFGHQSLQSTLGKYFDEQYEKSVFYNNAYL
jgi:AraC-like DNA-binding protein